MFNFVFFINNKTPNFAVLNITNQTVMKLLICISLFLLSFTSSANMEVTNEIKKDVATELTINNDRGRGKKSRKAKRTNKRRKRKCQQFGRKAYAG